MKRILGWGGATAYLCWLVVASCSNPLEVQQDTNNPVPFDRIDTVLLLDSVFVGDSVCDTMYITDSVFVGDSICDTLYVTDSVFVTDTIHQVDTVQISDTVSITDTIMVTDTVVVSDSVVVDTVVISDSVVVTDTLVIADTVMVTDTLTLTDTLTVMDTLLVTDTVIVTDTVLVEIPDSSGCTTFCSNLGSHSQSVVWMLDNTPGTYRLDFSGFAERKKPTQTLIISVGGEEYEWQPAVDDEFSIEVELGPNAEVTLTFDTPPALGHNLSVCLKVTEL